ncbi:MBL fold metallo-hydrolase [Thioalkalivibrio thiocyanodenitrificans]|uniref:MBL fold metallo-hydrolase n=1 Tax=Thioalkalivibrio thiocyanodenitrificans TaxID=243063 RepID=UPI000362FFCC|nr:MBL fold metallo-hydrolase [Thioalkalivibrio thiocyanodenitrificans]
MQVFFNHGWRVAGLLFLYLSGVAASESAPVDTPYGAVGVPVELHKLPDAPVYYIIGLSGVPDAVNEGHTSNAGFVVTEDGVVVFDALGTPALGYRMLQHIREVTDRPVRYVVVSHYHADHIYGLQAFKEHGGAPKVLAQRGALGYVGGTAASQGEDAERRLAQRREALFPWVDEHTYIVAPDQVFDREMSFELGGVRFDLRHLGPAHAPADAVMLVEDYQVLFSGDVIYGGRIPFLDSPETDIDQWLDGLDYVAGLRERIRYIIPGHGTISEDARKAVAATRDYIVYVLDAMAAAVNDMVPFDEAYENTDWSRYEDMPAFDASNRGNAYRIYLETEARSFQ